MLLLLFRQRHAAAVAAACSRWQGCCRWHGARLLLPGPGSAAALGFNHVAIEALGAAPRAHAVGKGLQGGTACPLDFQMLQASAAWLPTKVELSSSACRQQCPCWVSWAVAALLITKTMRFARQQVDWEPAGQRS